MTIKKLENFLSILFRQKYDIYFTFRRIENNSRWWSNGRTFIEYYMTYFSYTEKQNKTNKKWNWKIFFLKKISKQTNRQNRQNKHIKQRWDETYPTEFSNDTGFTIMGTFIWQWRHCLYYSALNLKRLKQGT